jgi:hypothetical protein
VNSAAKPTNLSYVIRLLAWGLGLLYVFSRLIPCHLVSDYTMDTPIDYAWGQALHVAFARHMQFGRDIVFTYGPWGFLARGYYPPTYLISVAARLVLAGVFIWAGWRVARSFTNNQVVIWLWLTGFTAMASLPLGNDMNSLLVAWGILLLFLHFLVEETVFSPLQAVLVLTLGWLGLVKFTGFVEGVVLVAVIALDNVFRHRRFPWIVPVWLLGIIFFWLLAGQEPGLLWPFLKNSWMVAGGYTDAMSQGDMFVRSALVYGVIGAGFCGLGGLLARPLRGPGGILFVSGLGGILFLSFKQGYVRNEDIHEIVAALTLLLIGLACVAVGLLCAASLFASLAIGRKAHAKSFCRQLVQTFSPYNLLSPIVSLTTHRLQDEYEKRVARIKNGMPLPPVAGGTDLYSYSQNILLANGLDYHPRPIIQSYSAYTPALAKMNAQWLQRDSAATHLFFAIQGLDRRFPSQDDGLSWPELLTRYDLKGISSQSGTFLCLSRSPMPREYHLQPLQEMTVMLGTLFTLPTVTNGPVWAEIEVKKNLIGDLLSFFYKPTSLMVDITLADQAKKTRRLVPGIVSTGFLLSPYIASNASFLALAKGDETALSGNAVVAMRLHESRRSGLSFCYQPQIKIRLYRLDFPAQAISFQVPQNMPDDEQDD